MIYSKTVTSSKNGTAGNPSRADISVTQGLIYQVEIYLPPGSSGLMHLWINDGAFQVWPSMPGESFYGDAVQIIFEDMYWIKASDHRLILWHYNLDDTYDHGFTVRIGQHSEEAFIASLMPGMGLEAINESIKGMVTAQEDAQIAAQESALAFFATEHPEPEGIEDL